MFIIAILFLIYLLNNNPTIKRFENFPIIQEPVSTIFPIDFVNQGVLENLIVETTQPCVTWSISKKKIVQYPETYEVITDANGNSRLSIENNRLVPVDTYEKLTPELIIDINNSNGILVYPSCKYYRFAFIPTT